MKKTSRNKIYALENLHDISNTPYDRIIFFWSHKRFMSRHLRDTLILGPLYSTQCTFEATQFWETHS